MRDFTSRWNKPPRDDGIGTKIKGGIKSKGPVKEKLEEATRQIQIHIAKLEQSSSKLKEKDALLFSRVVAAVQKNENSRANMLANELSEVRKMTSIITQTKLVLEQLALRLTTVKEFGDLAATLAPTMGVIRNIKPGLLGVMPEAEKEIGEISSLLSGILSDSGQLSPAPINFEPASDDAQNVIAEAERILEQRARENFPEVPATDPEPEAETA